MEDETEAQELTFSQLYERLLIEDDLILDELPASQLPKLRKGLSSHKTKLNERAKRADLPIEERRIEFEILYDYITTGTYKVRVYFAGEKKVIAKLIKSDMELK